MAIRRAREGDLAGINRLIHASRAYAGAYAAILEGYAVTPSQIAQDRVFLMERAGDLVGFYSLTVGAPPELDLFFVADDDQGTGLGTRLFRHMQAEALKAGIEKVRIVSHPPAAGFYRRMGARPAGTKPGSGRVAWARPVFEVEIGAPAHAHL